MKFFCLVLMLAPAAAVGCRPVTSEVGKSAPEAAAPSGAGTTRVHVVEFSEELAAELAERGARMAHVNGHLVIVSSDAAPLPLDLAGLTRVVLGFNERDLPALRRTVQQRGLGAFSSRTPGKVLLGHATYAGAATGLDSNGGQAVLRLATGDTLLELKTIPGAESREFADRMANLLTEHGIPTLRFRTSENDATVLFPVFDGFYFGSSDTGIIAIHGLEEL